MQVGVGECGFDGGHLEDGMDVVDGLRRRGRLLDGS